MVEPVHGHDVERAAEDLHLRDHVPGIAAVAPEGGGEAGHHVTQRVLVFQHVEHGLGQRGGLGLQDHALRALHRHAHGAQRSDGAGGDGEDGEQVRLADLQRAAGHQRQQRQVDDGDQVAAVGRRVALRQRDGNTVRRAGGLQRRVVVRRDVEQRGEGLLQKQHDEQEDDLFRVVRPCVAEDQRPAVHDGGGQEIGQGSGEDIGPRFAPAGTGLVEHDAHQRVVQRVVDGDDGLDDGDVDQVDLQHLGEIQVLVVVHAVLQRPGELLRRHPADLPHGDLPGAVDIHGKVFIAL